METLFSDKTEEVKTAKQKVKNLSALAILLAGLFLGSLFVDFAQLTVGKGFSHNAMKNYDLLETGGKTWVAYDDPKVSVQVITDRNCSECDPSEALIWLRRVVPTLQISSIERDSYLGKLLIARFSIPTLPAFIFSDNIAQTDFYAQASSLFAAESGRYFFDMGRIGLPIGKHLKLPKVNDDDIATGAKDAQVKIIEFSDFQCPYSKAFQADLNKIRKEYDGKVLFVYKHLPLSIHSQAENAALAASCANEQGKFQAYADNLFAKQEEWAKTVGTQKFKDYSWRFGLNGREFAKCLDTKKYQDEIDADKAEAASFFISGTPGTFVNGTFLPGAVGLDALKTAIDAELSKE